MNKITEVIRIYSLLNSTHKKHLVYLNPKSGKYRWMDRQGNVYEGKPDAKQAPDVAELKIDMGGYQKYEGEKGDSHWEAQVSFFKEHPNFEIEGEENLNLIKPEYRIVVETDQTQREYVVMKEKLAAAYKLNNLSYLDLRDNAFGLGTDPRELSHSALLVTLIGGSKFNGPAMTKRTKVNGEDMLEINLIRGKKYEEREMFVTVHKAIMLGVIEQKDGVYEVTGKTMGDTIPRAIEWCKGNSSFYNAYIVKNVQERDTINPDLKDLEEDIKLSEYQTDLNEKKKLKTATPAEKEEKPREPEESVQTAPAKSAAFIKPPPAVRVS